MTDITIQDLIASVLDDFHRKGFSLVLPFSVGKVEQRMLQFANVNGIELGGDELYMSVKQLLHSLRPSKLAKGLTVSEQDLIDFPQKRFAMDLYYDGNCFIYTDGVSKFIVHPNYKMKISREVVKIVNFITATKIKDSAEFSLPKYQKIEADYNSA